MDKIEKRIAEEQIRAAQARKDGDRERYWQARRALLLAQAELAKQSQRYGELPY